ncbi:MAG TPA: BON domain-containing protein [Verrucomicrobiae bacterium]|nr:BON domain-containing protein [Verrucomicrobiae bacterium]
MNSFLKTCIANMLLLVAIGVPVLGTGCERQSEPPIEPKSTSLVAGAGPSTGAPGASAEAIEVAAASPDDAALTQRVKTALMSDGQVKGVGIDVSTHDAQVTLKGTLDSDEQVTRAVAVARGVAGVRDVINRLSVRGEDKAATTNQG